MQTIDLDAANWSNVLDFYDALLKALGAPNWHGRSVAALVDTMIWHDEINVVTPPYVVCITHAMALPTQIREELKAVREALSEARDEFRQSEGRDVGVYFEII